MNECSHHKYFDFYSIMRVYAENGTIMTRLGIENFDTSNISCFCFWTVWVILTGTTKARIISAANTIKELYQNYSEIENNSNY